MQPEETSSPSLARELLRIATVEMFGFAVFILCLGFWMQMQNPGSWLSLKLKDAGEYLERKKKCVREHQMRNQVRAEIRAMETQPWTIENGST